ncbi:relaxase domain-containing protein [Streptomyces sp. NPDC005963]|uniref:relaxase domain-containing protein n=1 Tax=Streptomyces sp. NPDC005963 TaxID=3156721 RepID=UPI0033E234BF
MEDADREVRRLLEPCVRPEEFDRGEVASRQRDRATWVGDPGVLAQLGLAPGNEERTEPIAAVVSGRHAVHGGVVRTGGAPADLLFRTPTTVSWLWATAGQELRADLERAVLGAAYNTVDYLIRRRPLLGHTPARGFAAIMALHAIGHPWSEPPPPMLHVHAYVVGLLDEHGRISGVERTALYEDSLTREGGSYGRLDLANALHAMGFPIETQTGPGRRYFQVRGVPEKLWQKRHPDKGCAGMGQENDFHPWGHDDDF